MTIKSLNKCLLGVFICTAVSRAIAFSPVFNEIFFPECLWVADHIGLDVGNDRGPALGWSMRGTASQRDNKMTITQIVFYCANKAKDETSDEAIRTVSRKCEVQAIAERKALK